MLPAALQRDILRELVTVAPLLSAFDRLFKKTTDRRNRLRVGDVVRALAADLKLQSDPQTVEGRRLYAMVRKILGLRQFEIRTPENVLTVYSIVSVLAR